MRIKPYSKASIFQKAINTFWKYYVINVQTCDKPFKTFVNEGFKFDSPLIAVWICHIFGYLNKLSLIFGVFFL